MRAKLLLLATVINRSFSRSMAAIAGKKVTFASKNALGDGHGVLIGDPKTTPRGLIVIHEWWGMNEQIQEEGAHISKEGGFTVLVPDMYRGKVKLISFLPCIQHIP